MDGDNSFEGKHAKPPERLSVDPLVGEKILATPDLVGSALTKLLPTSDEAIARDDRLHDARVLKNLVDNYLELRPVGVALLIVTHIRLTGRQELVEGYRKTALINADVDAVMERIKQSELIETVGYYLQDHQDDRNARRLEEILSAQANVFIKLEELEKTMADNEDHVAVLIRQLGKGTASIAAAGDTSPARFMQRNLENLIPELDRIDRDIVSPYTHNESWRAVVRANNILRQLIAQYMYT